jgi:hypothetical protein
MKPPHCITWKCHRPNQLLSLWIALLVDAFEEYYQNRIVTYWTFFFPKVVAFFYSKHKALFHSCNSRIINYFVCLSSDWIQWNKYIHSLSTIFTKASPELYTVWTLYQVVSNNLIPPYLDIPMDPIRIWNRLLVYWIFDNTIVIVSIIFGNI